MSLRYVVIYFIINIDKSVLNIKKLLIYFELYYFQEVSARNKLNKAKQVINHRCGRKSFQAVSYDAVKYMKSFHCQLFINLITY